MKKKPVSNEKGQVLIFVTLAFVILGMFLGLAVDGGRAFLMRERLRSIVDAAALAGAKAMAGTSDPSQVLTDAVAAACDSAKVNGIASGNGECGGGGTKLNVEIGDVINPDGTTQQGVIVTGTDTSRTFFMALGGLVGCDSCRTINVAHTGKAAPDTLLDLVLVMDDTGTMNHNCNATFDNPECPIFGAKQGAITLINMLFANPNSGARVAFVPFRGCYASSRNLPIDFPADPTGRKGCILYDEIQDLTNDSAALTSKINTRFGAGGFPGTNICLGMLQGSQQLFNPNNSRAIARKVMVILTDGDQTYSDSADGPQGSGPPYVPPTGIPNLGNPTPTPYPATRYVTGVGDGGPIIPTSCMSVAHQPGDPNVRWGGGALKYNAAIDELDTKANDYASMLKNTDPRGQVEIYVLRFADPAIDDLSSGTPPGSCDPSLVGASGIDRGGKDGSPIPANASDIRDRNLSRCLASNNAMGDPMSANPNDHYFYAATAADINTKFQAIATNILRRRRLVA